MCDRELATTSDSSKRMLFARPVRRGVRRLESLVPHAHRFSNRQQKGFGTARRESLYWTPLYRVLMLEGSRH